MSKIDTLIIISNIHQAKNLISLPSLPENSQIIVLDSKAQEIIKSRKKDISITSLEELGIDENFYWKKALKNAKEYFDKLNNAKIGGKKIFSDILGFEGISLLDVDSIRYRSGHSERLAKVLYKVEVVDYILSSFRPKSVILLPSRSEYDQILKVVCESKGIRIIEYKNRFNISELSNILKSHFLVVTPWKFPIGIPKLVFPLLMKLRNWLLYVGSFKIKKDTQKRPYEKGDILIFVINKKYLDIIVPLVKSIMRDNIAKPLVLVQRNFDGFEKLNKEKIPYRFLESYLTASLTKKTNSAYTNIIKKWKQIKHQKEVKDQIYDYNGICLEPVLSDMLDKTILLSGESIRNILLIQHIARLHKAKVFVTPHFSENIVKSFVYGCQKIGIITIGMFRGTPGLSSEYGLFNGDIILLAGRHARETFVKWGVNEEKINVTSFPIFDELIKKLNEKQKISQIVRKKLNIPDTMEICTYLTQSYSATFGYNEKVNEIKIIYETIKKFENLFLIIKLHPTERDTEVYVSLAQEIGLKNYRIIKDEISLDDLLISSKIAITKNSTAGFNALIAGCNLIVLGFHNKSFEGNFFVEDGVALTATTPEELFYNIKKILKNIKYPHSQDKLERFLKKHFYKLDGKSVDRIKRVIYRSLKNDKKEM